MELSKGATMTFVIVREDADKLAVEINRLLVNLGAA